nr:MAG TPA: hypothetical protein [Caudoviricetes sp.]
MVIKCLWGTVFPCRHFVDTLFSFERMKIIDLYQ